MDTIENLKEGQIVSDINGYEYAKVELCAHNNYFYAYLGTYKDLNEINESDIVKVSDFGNDYLTCCS